MHSPPTASRIQRLAMPARGHHRDISLRAAERELESAPAPDRVLDLTYADTHRFPPPDFVLPRFTAAATGAGMTYTPYRGDADVREAVAQHLGAAFFAVDPETELLLTPGTQAGLFIALATLVEPDSEVVLADPEYLSTERMLRFFGANVTHVPLLTDETGLAHLDPDALAAALARRPALLILSNPNNPTGAVHSRESIERIAQLTAETDTPVLVDQLYCRLRYDDTPFTHLRSQQGMRDRCITLLGPSKTESMSGYRIGVAVVPDALCEPMEHVLSVSALRAPAYAQHILGPWLADDDDYVQTRIGEYQKLRDTAVTRLNAAVGLHVEPARGTAYLFPQLTHETLNDQQVARALRRQGLIVNPGYQFGPRGAGHFRVCFAQEEAAWSQALDTIVATVDELISSA